MKKENIESEHKTPDKRPSVLDDLTAEGASHATTDASLKSPADNEETAQASIERDWQIWPGNPS